MRDDNLGAVSATTDTGAYQRDRRTIFEQARLGREGQSRVAQGEWRLPVRMRVPNGLQPEPHQVSKARPLRSEMCLVGLKPVLREHQEVSSIEASPEAAGTMPRKLQKTEKK